MIDFGGEGCIGDWIHEVALSDAMPREWEREEFYYRTFRS